MAGLKSLQPPKPTQGTGLLRVLHWCDMALVPFSYANPFTDQLRLKERLFTINGHLLRIEQVRDTRMELLLQNRMFDLRSSN